MGYLINPYRFAAAGGGGGNAFTLVQTATPVSEVNTLTFGSATASGNLIVVFAKWEGTGSMASAVHGASGLTGGNVSNHGNGDLHCQLWWLLSSPGSQTTAVFTPSGSISFQRLFGMEFSATGTHALDAQSAGTSGDASGAGSQSIATGTFSSSVSVGLGIGAYGEYSARTTSAELIGGNAATGSSADSAELWYRLFVATLSSATAAATLSAGSAGDPYVMAGACFKAT